MTRSTQTERQTKDIQRYRQRNNKKETAKTVQSETQKDIKRYRESHKKGQRQTDKVTGRERDRDRKTKGLTDSQTFQPTKQLRNKYKKHIWRRADGEGKGLEAIRGDLRNIYHWGWRFFLYYKNII